MNATTFKLAQINIARIKSEGIDSPEMQSFIDQLDHINGLAESAPGFVWRLKDEYNSAVAFDPFQDKKIIINLSVWDNVQSLKDFTYATQHSDLIRARSNWFERLNKPHYALWWIPEGIFPSIEEAVSRLELLQAKGPSRHSFNFKTTFSAAGDATS